MFSVGGQSSLVYLTFIQWLKKRWPEGPVVMEATKRRLWLVQPLQSWPGGALQLVAAIAEKVKDRITAGPIFKPVDAPLAGGQQSGIAYVPFRDTKGKELPLTFM